MEDIVTLCMSAAQGASVLFVEGLRTDSSHSFAAQLNVNIARSLKAEVIVVADASAPNALGDLRFNLSQYQRRLQGSGVISDEAKDDFDLAGARRKFGQNPHLGHHQERSGAACAAHVDVSSHVATRSPGCR